VADAHTALTALAVLLWAASWLTVATVGSCRRALRRSCGVMRGGCWAQARDDVEVPRG
jgi:hypothetical protein